MPKEKHFHGQLRLKGGFDIDESTLHPNARYWSNGAADAKNTLAEIVGNEKADELVAEFWNNNHTWEEICKATEKVLESARQNKAKESAGTTYNHHPNEYTACLQDDEAALAYIDALAGETRFTTMQMIDGQDLFRRKSYRDKHVPAKTCPQCGGLLIVKERRRKLRLGGYDITPFVACAMWERTGCRYKEPFTDEIRSAIDNAIASVDLDLGI